METPTPATNVIQYDDFAKLELRVATVVECKAHPNADKLLVGKQIVVVANLAPRTMRGEISQGMLLAATDPNTNKVIFVSPSEAAAAGSKVS